MHLSLSQERRRHHLPDLEPIHSSGDDAPRVACALPAGVQARHVDALQAVVQAVDTHLAARQGVRVEEGAKVRREGREIWWSSMRVGRGLDAGLGVVLLEGSGSRAQSCARWRHNTVMHCTCSESCAATCDEIKLPHSCVMPWCIPAFQLLRVVLSAPRTPWPFLLASPASWCASPPHAAAPGAPRSRACGARTWRSRGAAIR